MKFLVVQALAFLALSLGLMPQAALGQTSDLIPQNISVPATVSPGANFTPSWTMANIGNAAANSTSTTVVRINQSTTSAAGSNLASVNTAALAAHSSVPQSATITAPTTPGTYYVWIIADNYGKVTNQGNTANDLQHSVAFTVQAPQQSDLIPQNISVPQTVAPGANFTPTWTLANIGSGAANSTSTTAVRINQSSSSASGDNLAFVSTPALAGHDSVPQNATITAPTTPGTYYVWIIADNYSKVTNQSNTSNDLQHSASFTVQVTGQSDLVPQNIVVPGTVTAGVSFTPTWSVANAGNAAANSTSTTVVRINQSSSSASGDNLASVSTQALAAGASQPESATITAPTTPGTYYVWIIADNYSQVTNQSNTANDLQHSAAFTIQAPQQSDLVPQNISVPTTVALGADFTPTWTLANAGAGAANHTSSTAIRINQSSSSSSGDDLAFVSTPALGGGASVPQSTTITAPTTPGTYYVWILADDFEEVTNQNNTTNDIQHSIAFTVQDGSKSDLIPQNINVPNSVTAGAAFTPTWSLANIGDAAANSKSKTVVRINQSATSASGQNLAFIDTPALAASASVAQSASVTAPTAPGTYYVWIVADNYSSVTNQSNTANDLQHSSAFTISATGQSDLLPQSIVVPSSLSPGAAFTPTWILANVGTAAANAKSKTSVRINQSATSASGKNLAFIDTAALAGGASAAQSASITAPTTPGTYYVWILADNYSSVTNQSNTTNDLQHSTPIAVQVSGQSDLIPQNISVPSTLTPGANFTPTWLLANIGSAAANSKSKTVVRITQSATSAAGKNLAFIDTAALAGGTSSPQSATITAPTDPGSYYVWILADNYGNVTNQSDKTNDLQHSAPIALQVTTPVLTVTPPSATVPYTKGFETFTVTNSGGGAMSYTSSIKPGAPWLSIEGSGSGGNSGTIKLSYTANSGDQRIGVLTVTALGATNSPMEIDVTQQGQSTFGVGTVVVVQPLGGNVRNGPAGTVLFVQDGGVYGAVQGQPRHPPGETWWNILWDGPGANGTLGWSAQSILQLPPETGTLSTPDWNQAFYNNNPKNRFFPDNAPHHPPQIMGELDKPQYRVLGNCTWYAYGRMLELGYDQAQLDTFAYGNAEDWYTNAKNSGIAIDEVPQKGDVGVLGASSFSSIGHVAVVEWVSSDATQFVVSESSAVNPDGNYAPSENYFWRHRLIIKGAHDHNITNPYWFDHFIHMPPPAPKARSISRLQNTRPVAASPPSSGTEPADGPEAKNHARWIWPLQETSDRSAIIQGYENYRDGLSAKRRSYHTGLDIAVAAGAAVVAANEGYVSTFMRSSKKDHGEGNTVILAHDGGIYSQYQHLRGLDPSLERQITDHCSTRDQFLYSCSSTAVEVRAGDRIGYADSRLGDTGRNASHLHFEVRKFAALSPPGVSPPEFGYTSVLPDTLGFIDPSRYLDGAVKAKRNSPISISPAGGGKMLRWGPREDYPTSFSVRAGEKYWLRQIAPKTGGCSAGWFQVSKSSEDPVSPIDYIAHLPAAWICRGNNGVAWVTP